MYDLIRSFAVVSFTLLDQSMKHPPSGIDDIFAQEYEEWLLSRNNNKDNEKNNNNNNNEEEDEDDIDDKNEEDDFAEDDEIDFIEDETQTM